MARMKKAPKKIVKQKTYKAQTHERKSENPITFLDARRDPIAKPGLRLCFKVSPNYQVKRGDHVVLSAEPVFANHLPTQSCQTRCSVDSAALSGETLYSILLLLPPSGPSRYRQFVYYVMPDGKIIARSCVLFNSDGGVQILSTEIPRAELPLTPGLNTATDNIDTAGQSKSNLSGVNSEMVKIWSTNFCKEKPSLLNKSTTPTQDNITLNSDIFSPFALRNVTANTDDVVFSVKDIVRKFEELRRQQEAESLELKLSRNRVADPASYDPRLMSLIRSIGQIYPPPSYQNSGLAEADLQVLQHDDILAKRLSYLTMYLKAKDYVNRDQLSNQKPTSSVVSQPPDHQDTHRLDVNLLRMENEVLYNQVNLLSRRIELMQEKELEIGQMFISQISRQEAELREKNETIHLLRSQRAAAEGSCSHAADSEAAELCIAKLEWSVAEKSRELEQISSILDEVKGQRTLIHHNNSLSLARNEKFRKHKASTNTDTVQTREQSIDTCSKNLNEVRPVVQKATSYAAPTGAEKIHSAEMSDKRPTTLSERERNKKSLRPSVNRPKTDITYMSASKHIKIPEWMSLFKRVDNTTPSHPASQSDERKCAGRISESSISDESMGNAIRALFGESSLSSIENLESDDKTSAKDSDSVLECLCDLLGLGAEERVLAKSRWSSSVPATPCNSRSESKTEQEVSEPHPSLSTSSSLAGALRRLFAVESDCSTSSSSTQSLTDLGEAMRRLFHTASMDQFGMAPKPSLFGTSNASLADAVKLLFDSKSKSTIDSADSLDSIPIWSLFDSESEGAVANKTTHTDTTRCDTMFDIEKWLASSKSSRRTSPHVSSIIRTSSPIRDVNIAYPKPKSVSFPSPPHPTEVDNSKPSSNRSTKTHHRYAKPRCARNCQRSLHSKRCIERARKIKPTHLIDCERRNLTASRKRHDTATEE